MRWRRTAVVEEEEEEETAVKVELPILSRRGEEEEDWGCIHTPHCV